MDRGEVQAAMDRLQAVPLEAFVAERTKLAKELRTGGDRPAADEVARLPKPSAAAWALNHVAREQPGEIEDWLEAAAALRDASTHPAEIRGDELRAAMAAHRAATARLSDVVRDRAQPGGRPLSEAMLDRVRTLLHSATADAGIAERLRAGRVTEEPAPPDAEAEREPPAERAATAPEPAGKRAGTKPRRRAPERAETAPEPAGKRAAAEARAERRAERERRVAAAEEEAERLGDEAARREEEAEAAAERLEDARRSLDRAESESSTAREAAEGAATASAAADRELRQLRARLKRASR
jgi:hypothetical protein